MVCKILYGNKNTIKCIYLYIKIEYYLNDYEIKTDKINIKSFTSRILSIVQRKHCNKKLIKKPYIHSKLNKKYSKIKTTFSVILY